MTHLSDEFLLAYLDGQLEKGQSAQVTDLIAENAEVSMRVKRLRRTQSQLAETFGAIARENVVVPEGLIQPADAGARGRANTVSPTAAAKKAESNGRKGGTPGIFFLAVVFASGILGGYSATFLKTAQAVAPQKDSERPPREFFDQAAWPADITRFHSFFPRETLTPYPDAISNPELIRFQLSKITARAITPPDFSYHGYTLFRGQTFNYRQDRMMQLTYASKTEPPLTLYVLPASEASDVGIATQSLGSTHAVSWIADRVRFLLTGEKNIEDLKILAVLAQSQILKRS
jgi:anti-sigma factor RsiW